MSPEAALQQAAGLFNAGRLDEARSAALAIVAAQPAHFLALHLLGAIAVRANRPDEAIGYETRALALKPGDPEALCNRGIAFRALDRIEEALADYEAVLAARPAFAAAHGLKGVALAALNRHEEAIASYSKALSLDPKYAPARFNRAFSELILGDYANGFEDFEARWAGSDTLTSLRAFAQPQWQREDLRGKTLFIHAEQGFGDALNLCRYVPLAVERGAKVILEAHGSLKELFTQLPAQVIALGEAPPPFDLHCPIMSLPNAFGTRLETIPSKVPYLHAPETHVAKWRERLGARDRPRIGIAWSGNASQKNDRNRSMPLELLAPLRNPAWSFVSLQKEVRGSDRGALAEGPPIRHFGEELGDFRDTAALVEAVDVVVTVDSSVAHLAGAMGKPVWILLSFAADWRYPLDRNVSPWYPTSRVFRQETRGAWAPVIERVGEELALLLA
jgi:hypothetical protein